MSEGDTKGGGKGAGAVGVLEAIAPRTVERRVHDVDSLRRAAEAASQKFHHIRFSPGQSRVEMLDAIAREFDFPAYFGRNLDALHDCLTDFTDGQLIVLDGVASHADGVAILEVFRSAAAHYAKREIPFRVLYS